MGYTNKHGLKYYHFHSAQIQMNLLCVFFLCLILNEVPNIGLGRSLNIQSCQSSFQAYYISTRQCVIPLANSSAALLPISYSNSLFPSIRSSIIGGLTLSSSRASGLSLLKRQKAKLVYYLLLRLNGQVNF